MYICSEPRAAQDRRVPSRFLRCFVEGTYLNDIHYGLNDNITYIVLSITRTI